MYPILFKWGEVSFYAYGSFIGIGFVLGLILVLARAGRAGISFAAIVDLFFYSALSAVVGSRLLYVLINFDHYRRNPIDALKLWEGGVVFYGGFALAAVAAVAYMRRHRLNIWGIADLFAPSVALGLVFGRIGCFLAGCCYGKETSLPWGVTFTHSESLARLNVALHPTQLYDAVNGLAIFLVMLWLERRKSFDGRVFWLFLLWYSVFRFIVEMFRGDPRGSFLHTPFSTSQGIGLLFAIVSLFMLFYLKGVSAHHRGDQPGGRIDGDGHPGDREVSGPPSQGEIGGGGAD